MSRNPDRLSDSTWPQIGRLADPLLLVLPVGSVEQHGPHLPLDTDGRIAGELATRLVAHRSDATLAPTWHYGSSGEHAGFPGTISIGQDALELGIIELGRSLGDEFRGTILVSGHGGNLEPLVRAGKTLNYEGRPTLAWFPTVDESGDVHAGHGETSMMLAIDPGAVRASEIAPGLTTPWREIAHDVRSRGVRAVSQSGVVGDPTRATAAEGIRILEALARKLIDGVEAWVAGL